MNMPTDQSESPAVAQAEAQCGHEHFSLMRRFLWLVLFICCWLWFHLLYRFRVHNAHHMPRDGATLIVSSHQSFLDPLFIGVSTRNRPFFSMARRTLWKNKFLGKVIDQLNTIALDQQAADLKAMRRGVEVLKAHHGLLIFAEGSRSPDGEVHAFEPGMMLLIRRAKPVVVPTVIEGAFDLWPIHNKRPKLFGRVHVMFGEPITAEELLADKDAAVEKLHAKVCALRIELREKMGLPI